DQALSPAQRAEAVMRGTSVLETRPRVTDVAALESEGALLEDDLETLAQAIRLAERAQAEAEASARRAIVEAHHLPGYRQLVEQLAGHLAGVLEVSEKMCQAREAAGQVASSPECWLPTVEKVVEVMPANRGRDGEVFMLHLVQRALDKAQKFI